MLNTKLKITFVAITAALLSGCFASSGGTVAPVAAVTTPPVTTQCAANTTCIPDMSAFSIQISKDASDNWISTGTVTTLGATTSTVARDPTTGAPTSATITGGVSTTVAVPTSSDPDRIGGTAADGQQVDFWTDISRGVQPTSASPTTGLQYSTFGVWSMAPLNVSTKTKTWTFGGYAGGDNFTMTMPTTGSATYTGRVDGLLDVANNNTRYNLNGNLNLTANFATSAITGSMTGMAAYAQVGNSTSWFNDVALAGTISGNAFTGTTTAGALPAGVNAAANVAAIAVGTVGTTSGHFYGPAANEVTGLWGMSGGGVTVVGAFGAKQ